MNEDTLIALEYACRTSVSVPSTSTEPTQYTAFRPRPPHKVNGVVQTHGWNGDPLPTDPLPIDNAELGLLALWDALVPVNLSTVALGPDDYWVARPLVDEIDLPEEFPGAAVAVYRLYDSAGQLLYVGQSGSFADRVVQHQDWNGKGTENQEWKQDIDWSKTTLECHWGRKAALAREKHLIQVERPRYNVQHAVR